MAGEVTPRDARKGGLAISLGLLAVRPLSGTSDRQDSNLRSPASKAGAVVQAGPRSVEIHPSG